MGRIFFCVFEGRHEGQRKNEKPAANRRDRKTEVSELEETIELDPARMAKYDDECAEDDEVAENAASMCRWSSATRLR